MGVFAFQKETVFTLDGRTYKLLRKVEPDIWQAEELRTGRIHEFSDEGLRDLYAKGKLKASIAGTSPHVALPQGKGYPPAPLPHLKCYP